MWSRRPSATWRANHGSSTTAPRREESRLACAGWRQLDLELETYKRLGASLSRTSPILPCRDEAGARQLPSMETRRLHRNSAATRQLDDDLEMYKRAAAVKTRPDAKDPATLQDRRHSRRDPSRSRSRSRSRSECSHDAPRDAAVPPLPAAPRAAAPPRMTTTTAGGGGGGVGSVGAGTGTGASSTGADAGTGAEGGAGLFARLRATSPEVRREDYY